jgi:hypothetical protein
MKKKLVDPRKVKVPGYVTEIAASAYIYSEMHGGYWKGERPGYPRERWLREIKLGATLKGYWEWAASFI